MVAATAGVDTLFWVDPTTGSADPLGDYARASTAVARAVTENRIGRVALQSSVGAEKRQGAGEIDGLAGTELALDATGADVTHLRCGFFFTNLELQLDAIRAGAVPVILPLDQPLAWVAPRDIAEVAVGRLLSTAWSGRCGGSASTTTRCAASCAAEMIDGLVEGVIGMSTGLRDGFVPEQPRTVEATTPTTLASWAYDVLRPQL